MRIRISILVFFNFYVFTSPVTFAESRRLPGWSAYFSAQTIRTTHQRDAIRVKINLSIHQLANGNHAKSMAIRAYLYQYCWEQARKYMQESDIDWRWLKAYQQYTYLQTQLYQYLQPTVQKIRVIMNDKDISFPIVLSHLQSNDTNLLYYYWTIPQRYIDTVFFTDIAIVSEWLRRYKTANDTYPVSLLDLITYKFISSNVSLSNKKIIYRAYNIPDITIYSKLPPQKYILLQPWYIMLYQAQYKNNIEYIDTLEAVRNKVRTYDFWTRAKIKKIPFQDAWRGIWWKIDIPDSIN